MGTLDWIVTGGLLQKAKCKPRCELQVGASHPNVRKTKETANDKVLRWEQAREFEEHKEASMARMITGEQ